MDPWARAETLLDDACQGHAVAQNLGDLVVLKIGEEDLADRDP